MTIYTIFLATTLILMTGLPVMPATIAATGWIVVWIQKFMIIYTIANFIIAIRVAHHLLTLIHETPSERAWPIETPFGVVSVTDNAALQTSIIRVVTTMQVWQVETDGSAQIQGLQYLDRTSQLFVALTNQTIQLRTRV